MKAVRKAGGRVNRVGKGRLEIEGPDGTTTIHEPGDEQRKDLGDQVGAHIKDSTGLDI